MLFDRKRRLAPLTNALSPDLRVVGCMKSARISTRLDGVEVSDYVADLGAVAGLAATQARSIEQCICYWPANPPLHEARDEAGPGTMRHVLEYRGSSPPSLSRPLMTTCKVDIINISSLRDVQCVVREHNRFPS